jgi:arsenical pump membrane protein
LRGVGGNSERPQRYWGFVQELTAYSTVVVTMSLALARPRIKPLGVRVGPGAAAVLGVAAMLLCGAVGMSALGEAFITLWQPLLTVFAIMVITRVAHILGLLDYLAGLLERCTVPRLTAAGWESAPGRAYATVFVTSCITAAALNNDAAVLLLTPIVLAVVRRRYPGHGHLIVPFAFAVFLGAGVAPLVTSNPINLVVADIAGIGFNAYAVRMIPVAVAGWAASFAVLWLIFRRKLAPVAVPEPAARPPGRVRGLSGPAGQALVLLATALAAYPVMSYFDGPLWLVAISCAALGVLLCSRQRMASPAEVFRSVSWEILLFLFCVFVIVLGLRNVGLVDQIAEVYRWGGASRIGQVATVGLASALGSAAINNHPMAILNALALERLSDVEAHHFLAALVGGDLGPRLLPTGSLAGLLWLESLRRAGVHVSVRQFCLVGVAVTVPALAVSLLVLLLV